MSATAIDYALAARLAGEQILFHRRRDPWADERREAQTPPSGDWRTWLVMAGRGFGKTRTGAEWVREQALSHKDARIALVGSTAADVRDVMVEALLVTCDRYAFRPRWHKSERRLDFPNGARAWTYSAEEPDRLRGPQHTHAWSDEVAAWSYPETWDMLQFGLRLGANPRQVATTTPRPVPIVKDLLSQRASGAVVVTAGSSYDNAANLAPAFIEQIIIRYEGTRLGRQEIHAELLEDVPGALWTLALIDDTRVREAPPLRRIVVGVDPAASDGEHAAETGIVVAGITGRGAEAHGYVLADATVRGSPNDWARAVVAAYRRHGADRVIAEINNGGAMVEHTLRTVDRSLPITVVHASRGKIARAEPVAALFEQGRVHHVGSFAALEDQMTTYDGSGDSPDRLDAMVWALTDLMLGSQGATLRAL